MKPRLTFRAIPVPREDAERRLRHACSLLAEGLADLFIAEARAEIAAELGEDPEGIDREGGRLAEEVERLSAAPGLARAGGAR